jgi:hypothetical protein
MNSPDVVDLAPLTKDFVTCTGVAKARKLLARLIIWSADNNPKDTVVLDFRGVEVASASFLREAVLAFRDYVRVYQPDAFPVVGNLSDAIREEFDVLLRQRGEAMLGCVIDATGAVIKVEVLGELEPGLDTTLAEVRQHGQLTLGDLRKTNEDVKASTWSNRLASLVRQGFVIPDQDANRRVYRFALTEAGASHGT